MSIIRTLFIFLFCFFVAERAVAQTVHYDNSLNYSGTRMVHDSLEPLSARLDAMMPDAVTTPFKVYSVVEYTLVKNQQAETREALKARVIADVKAQFPYQLVFWWTAEGVNLFKQVEIGFSFPNDEDYGNCFTGAKIGLIQAQLQQFANGLLPAYQPDAGNYAALEVQLLSRAEELVAELKSCCANKNKSGAEECSLCVSGEGLDLMKTLAGFFAIPTTTPLDVNGNYLGTESSLSTEFENFFGTELQIGSTAINFNAEYTRYRTEYQGRADHKVVITTDNRYCDNAIATPGNGGLSIINVSIGAAGPEIEVMHVKSGDNISFAEALILNHPDIFGDLVDTRELSIDELYFIEDGGPDEEGYLTGTGAILTKRYDGPNSDGYYLIEEATLAKFDDFPILSGSLYSFVHRESDNPALRFRAYKHFESNNYLGYFSTDYLESAVRVKGPLSTLMMIESVPENEFNANNSGWVAQAGETVYVVSIAEECSGVVEKYWNQLATVFSVKGVEKAISIPPSAVSQETTAYSPSDLCCRLGFEYVERHYARAELLGADQARAVLEIGQMACDIGMEFFQDYDNAGVWGEEPDMLKYLTSKLLDNAQTIVDFSTARDRFREYKDDIFGDFTESIVEENSWKKLKRTIHRMAPDILRSMPSSERLRVIQRLAPHLDRQWEATDGINNSTGQSFQVLGHTEETILKLLDLEGISESEVCNFTIGLFSDEDLVEDLFLGFDDYEFLFSVDGNFTAMVSKLYQLYMRCFPALVSQNQATRVDGILIIGGLDFPCADIIDGECFSNFQVDRQYRYFGVMGSGQTGWRCASSGLVNLSFSRPADFIVVKFKDNQYGGLSELTVSYHIVPSFMFCYFKDFIFSNQVRIVMEGALIAGISAATFAEAALGQGVLQALAIAEIVLATSSVAFSEIILSPAFRDLYLPDRLAEYNQLVDNWQAAELYANTGILIASAGTSIAGPMRRAYKASKLAKLDNATPAQVNAIEQVAQAVAESGEKLFPEFPKVANFVEDLPNNPLPNGVESLRRQYTKALAELDEDALRTLNVDLIQQPNLLSGDVGRVGAWKVLYDFPSLRRSVPDLESVSSFISAKNIDPSLIKSELNALPGFEGDLLRSFKVANGTSPYPLLRNTLPPSTDGALYGTFSNGQFVPTANAPAGGTWDFVVMPNGEIKVGSKHSWLSDGGQDVIAAGEISISNGIVEEITNASGHYIPTTGQGMNYLRIFKNQGVDIESAHLYLNRFSPVNGFQVVRDVHPFASFRSIYD